MAACRLTPYLVCLAAALLLAAPAQAGLWITPDWPAGKEPQFKPVPLYWFEVRGCPIVYRAEIEVSKESDRATVLARTSGYLYVYVDGKLVYGWAPRAKTDKSPEVPADPNRVHEVDLSAALAPGKHALVASAPAGGFVLDGGLYDGAKRLSALGTDGKWTVAKFAPTTVLEDEPIMRPGWKGDAAPVKAGDAWSADEDALARTFYAATAGRLRRDLDEAVWRLDLLVKKGIYVVDGAAYGWGGPLRPAGPEAGAVGAWRVRVHAGGGETKPEEITVSEQLERVAKLPVESAADLAKAMPVIRLVCAEVEATVRETEKISRNTWRADEAKAISLASTAAAGSWPAGRGPTLERTAQVRGQLEKSLGHPLPRLNESRYDRLGWIEHAGLTDSDISRWGVRINPVTGPTKVTGPNRWLFATDPKDEGIKELRWSIGYNIETQMAAIDGGRGWQADKRFADYKGPAWYRGRLHVPGEWAGNEVVLTVPVAGTERLWLNDKELTDRGAGQGRRTYKLAPEDVTCGGENVLALRIQADGERRGLVGTVEAACPALEGEASRKTPRVDVLATPLSPCVVLTPETDTLEIHHAGKGRLMMPGSGRPIIEMDNYESKGGRLFAGNWVMLWLAPASPTAAERPILLAFEKSPASIACEPGLTRLKFPAAGRRVIAVRPWAKARPPQDPAKIAPAAAFWSQAAMAVPVNFMCVTRVAKPGEPYDGISVDKVPAGPVIEHTYIYDYLETKDEWGTRPLRAAPLPAFCSYAVDTKFRGLALDQAGKVEVLQDGGMLAPYRGVKDTDRISYRYPVEPYPRLAGFTSWMFSPVDTGVPGNKRELELIARIGANSYRPQHNWSDQAPPKGMFPETDKRTRVEIMADACSAVGANYMNNIDQTLGKRPEYVRENYDAFMQEVDVHYEKIARQLTGRAFWQVAYDLINEPFDHKHERYNPAMKELTRRVRAIDRRHLLYIEPCEAWGAIQQLSLIEPTGDPLTVYSFHDYNFRLLKPADRWPTPERDITSIYQMWMPAFIFQIKHGAAMHCGEYGGFAESTDDSLAQTVLMNDFLRIFDQFGMHHHYYTGRGVYERLADGSIRPSNVVRAWRAYAARPGFNAYYRKWPGYPTVEP